MTAQERMTLMAKLTQIIQGESLRDYGISEVVHGASGNVDHGAANVAHSRGIKVFAMHAAWSQYGRAAGPIRNSQMAAYVKPDAVCFLWPGGAGTADMRRKARAKGVVIVEVMPPHQVEASGGG